MGKQMKPGYFLCCLICLTALVTEGCAINRAAPVPAHAPGIEAPGQTRNLIDCISNQYPDQFNALHNVGLNIRGETITLKGFLKVNRPKGLIHLIAQGDMGGTLFEVHILKGQPDVVSAKGFFKETWLEESVVRDLKRLYLIPCFNSPRAYTGQDGQMILSDSKDSRTDSLVFDAQARGGLLVSEYRQLKENRLDYAIVYGYAPGAGLPIFIRIEDRILNYTLNINVRYMTPRTQ